MPEAKRIKLDFPRRSYAIVDVDSENDVSAQRNKKLLKKELAKPKPKVDVLRELVNPFVPNPALKRVKTGWLLRIFKNSYVIARTFRLHTQVPNALEKHLK